MDQLIRRDKPLSLCQCTKHEIDDIDEYLTDLVMDESWVNRNFSLSPEDLKRL